LEEEGETATERLEEVGEEAVELGQEPQQEEVEHLDRVMTEVMVMQLQQIMAEEEEELLL
jgi:hypothetical protein